MLLDYKMQKRIIIFFFLMIPLLFTFIFFVYPVIGLICMSFSEYNGYSNFWTSAKISLNQGFLNYKELFENPKIFGTIFHNMAYLISGIFQLVFGILIAVLINKKFSGKNIFRMILFLPFIINSISVVYMFYYMYQPNGPYNNLLMYFHIINEPIRFLSNKHLVNYSLSFISFWQYLGFYTVIFLAGLQTIPVQIYEASKLDGANGFQNLWHITIPNLKPLIQVNTFLILSGSLQAFNGPYLLTKGGPGGASDTLISKVVEIAFKFSNYGLAASLSLITGLLIIILTIFQRMLFKEE